MDVPILQFKAKLTLTVKTITKITKITRLFLFIIENNVSFSDSYKRLYSDLIKYY